MAQGNPVHQALAELRRLAPRRALRADRRGDRRGDPAVHLARLLGACTTHTVEERAGGLAFRLVPGSAELPAFTLTCVLQTSDARAALTPAEQGVATLLIEGRTRAQIARLRGVSANTVKTQVRQIFRKLDVGSRVELVRKLCP